MKKEVLSKSDKEKYFTTIVKLIDDNYVRKDILENKWNDIVQKYSKKLEHIKFFDELYLFLDDMLLELGDPHTRFRNLKSFKIPKVVLTDINDDIYISGICYSESKLKVGFKLISVNGINVKELLKEKSKKFKFRSINIIKINTVNELSKSINVGDVLLAEYDGKIVEDIVTSSDEIITDYFNKSNKDKLKNEVIKKFHDVLYFNLISFRSKEIVDKLEKVIHETEVKKLIIDLRVNNGGLVELAKRAAGLFLENDIVIGYTQDRNKKISPIEIISTSNYIQKVNKIIILVGENTGSCAENIFLKSLKDSNKKIVVIGTKTMGLIDQATEFKFNDGSVLQVTTKVYLDKNKEKISNDGIDANIVVNLDSNIFNNVDRQLNKALDFMKGDTSYV